MFSLSRQSVTTFFLIFLCIIGVGLIQFTRLQKHNSSNIASFKIEKKIKSEKLRLMFLKNMPSFGYKNLIADWVYLDFLQYFGDDEIREKTGYSLSPEYFEVILGNDPRFLTAYIGLSTSTSMYAAMPKRSVALMEKSLKSLSPWVPEKSYYVWRYKGIDELLFLGNSTAARQSFETAANWANNYSDEESKQVITISQKTADFLSHNPDSKHAQIASWAMVLNNHVDEKTRKIAIGQIEALGGKVISTPQGNQIKFPKKD
ncbi:hypothetical protein PI95_013420 [Hassallia byssoidea VB512170]|uniref:Uncharacterized protein n=1 Tax=Hassallia byssoidea VB512170 TaxID=1304833 RepID=A0A846H7C6_9CYAN|nr:hypothetical protein [Hassalia byssoidea]NEU73537.1 hypothetical protein [Hassalia byssoidea VB512170]